MFLLAGRRTASFQLCPISFFALTWRSHVRNCAWPAGNSQDEGHMWLVCEASCWHPHRHRPVLWVIPVALFSTETRQKLLPPVCQHGIRVSVCLCACFCCVFSSWVLSLFSRIKPRVVSSGLGYCRHCSHLLLSAVWCAFIRPLLRGLSNYWVTCNYADLSAKTAVYWSKA